MAFTRINLSQIQGVTETSDGKINIEKNINFTEQISLPLIPPSQDTDGVLWVDPSTGTFKNRINLVNYSASFKGEFKNIAFGSSDTLSLGGNTGIVNDLVVSGTNTVLNIRSNSFGTAQWSVLEIKGNLTVASGCTLNLIRTPLIVRGSIIGNGIITSPNGVNGGLGGAGGIGGSGGAGRLTIEGDSPFTLVPFNGVPGSLSPNLGQPGGLTSGGPNSFLPVEYGVSSGGGSPGMQGGRGGGGGAGFNLRAVGGLYLSGTGGASTFPGGASTPHSFNPSLIAAGGGGGGGAGGGVTTSPNGGLGITAPSGSSGTSVGSLNVPYTGIGNPTSPPSLGTPGGPTAGTFGGAGGRGALLDDGAAGVNGSLGGTGGNGGAGGGTGGAHISIFCAGTVSSSLTIRPGKGGLTGGSTSLPRAQTGSLWLFTINNDPINIDLTGATGTPNGPAGVLNRTLTSNSSGVTDFFNNILFEPNGIISAKNKIGVTI